MFSAHFFRQTQTAQTADLYLNGYTDFLNPAVYFLGKPGYMLLEFPLYQYLVAMLSKFSGIKLEHSAIILNFASVAVLLYSLAFLSTAFSTRKKPSPKSAEFYIPFLISPLLLGTSFWFSIEVFTLALTCASLACFLNFISSDYKSLRTLFVFSLTSAFSLAIKPNYIYCVIPIFLFLLYRHFQNLTKKKIILFAASMISVLALFYLWNKHVTAVSAKHYNPFAIKDNLAWYLWGKDPIQFKAIATLASRIFFYLTTPVALFILAYKKDEVKNAVPLVISFALYLLTFSNLNIHHSYYQLPLLIPVYLLIAPTVSKIFSTKYKIAAFALLALTTSSIAYVRLIKEDQDWVHASIALKEKFQPSLNEPPIVIQTNNEAGAIAIAYELHRFVEYGPKISTQKPGTLLLCDTAVGADCRDSTQTWTDFGHVSFAVVR